MFQAPMVRAILDGTKSQTRRPVKPQPEAVGLGPHCEVRPYVPGSPYPLAYYQKRAGVWNSRPLACIYGKVGDRLWVKESFKLRPGADICYRTSANPDEPGPWKPARYMPKTASRITLEITNIRVERLQAITPRDIMAEGVVLRPHHDKYLGQCPVSAFDNKLYVDLRTLWHSVWQGINGKTFPWDSDPFVWVLEFRRI